jgi:hypothetical protein
MDTYGFISYLFCWDVCTAMRWVSQCHTSLNTKEGELNFCSEFATGIYLLNLFLAFLQPKFDPSLDNADMDTTDGGASEDGPSLPTKNDEEFRPFIRRLPEFKFWYSTSKAIFIALVCSFFSIFDIPVFWPILLIYFCILFAITMRRQIKHMIKYKYVPFDLGKKNYAKSSK